MYCIPEKKENKLKKLTLIAFVVTGIDVFFVTTVHGSDQRLALEETLDVLVVVELIVARRRLRGGLAVVVLVMGRDLTEHHAVVLLQQGIA